MAHAQPRAPPHLRTGPRVRGRSGCRSRAKPRPSPLARASLWAQLPEAEPGQPWSPPTRPAPADFPRSAARQHGALSTTQALSSVHLPRSFPGAGHTVPGCAMDTPEHHSPSGCDHAELAPPSVQVPQHRLRDQGRRPPAVGPSSGGCGPQPWGCCPALREHVPAPSPCSVSQRELWPRVP